MRRLTIYVMEDCLGCERARGYAYELLRRCPEATIEVVDLSTGGAPPPFVFSVPTYVLDGRVVSLGNPRLDMLVGMLERCGAGTGSVS